MASDGKGGAASAAPVIRHDFFQTDTQVVISLYVRGCQAENVHLDVQPTSLSLTIDGVPAGAAPQQFHIPQLFAAIDSTNAGIRVIPAKVEISLPKAQPGLHWSSLRGTSAEQPSISTPSTSTITDSTPSSSAVPAMHITSQRPPRSKWDSFKADEEEGVDGAGNPEDASIDAFFKKLYADADDDTRRAMMKSYQESGGTALSTNWAEVKKGKVETRPPDGMEARKY